MKRTLLVTGGAGFIGSHTVVTLLQEGHNVIVVDDLSNSRMEAVRRIKKVAGRDFAFYQTDVRNAEAMDRLLRRHPCDAIIHFAGLKAVGESVANPLLYYRANLNGTMTLLSLMEAHNIKVFVFSSTATVYGTPESSPIPETAPAGQVHNPYAASKWMQECIVRDCAALHRDWSAVLLRYFNPIGAHPSGQLGEDPQGVPNNLAPYIAQVAIGRRPHLNVMGDDYATPDGTGVRDYIHVMDLAEGHTAALNYAESHPGVHVFNLGTGQGASVFDVLHAFERAVGRTIPYRIVPRRAGDIDQYFGDATKAKETLGWQATRSLDTMCADMWRFQQANPNGYEDRATV